MAYLAYTDLETFLNITLASGGQSLANAIIAGISAYADRYCNRTWASSSNTEITETFDGGTDAFFVKNPPIASVVSVTEDGDELSAEDEDYFVYDTYVKFPVKALSGSQNVVIKYKTTATAIPADLKHALVQWASQIFKSQSDGGKVATRVSTGPVAVDFIAKDGVPQFVQMVLDAYRLIPV
jgi:hypothetical protein